MQTSYLDAFICMDWVAKTLVEEAKVEINTCTGVIELGDPGMKENIQ